MDQAELYGELDKAEADIVDGHARIERQRRLIAHLGRDGHNTEAAEELLQVLQQTLGAMEEHRRIIMTQLGR